MNGPEADVQCPRCGAGADRGQLVCLECGARIALVYRRPPSWKVPVAITAVVALLLGGGAFAAVSALSNEADREVAAAPPRPKPVATRTEAGTHAAKPDAPKPAAGQETIVKQGALYRWPGTLGGFTVVINSTEDRASAIGFANSAAKANQAKVGVIRADDFKTLPKGFYVVFAGFYKSRAEADRATGRLGRTYQGAFTQAVQR